MYKKVRIELILIAFYEENVKLIKIEIKKIIDFQASNVNF